MAEEVVCDVDVVVVEDADEDMVSVAGSPPRVLYVEQVVCRIVIVAFLTACCPRSTGAPRNRSAVVAYLSLV